MNRHDVLIDIVGNDDLHFENNNNPFFNGAVWEGTQNGNDVLAVTLTSLGDNRIDVDSVNELVIDTFVQIPKAFESERSFEIYVTYTDQDQKIFMSSRFIAVDSKNRPISPFDVQRIDQIGQNIRFDASIRVPGSQKGAFVVTTYEEGDFEINDAINQNEKMLLLANRGNYLAKPTRGVEITRELNGVRDQDALELKIRTELLKDDLVANEIQITQDNIALNSKEKFET